RRKSSLMHAPPDIADLPRPKRENHHQSVRARIRSRTADMRYSYRIFESIEDVDPVEWGSVQEVDASPLTDPRMLRVLERTLKDQSQCWPLLIRDEQGQPAAVTCLSLFR